jgi:hypothetical protein
MEYHPDFAYREGHAGTKVKSNLTGARDELHLMRPKMPEVKPPKDPKIEEDALLKIMQLAIFGAVMHAGQNQENQFEATERVVDLFKEANLIK